MLPRVFASLLCALGAAAIGLGAASATIWRASDTLTAVATAPGYLVTEPGVLDLAADEVTVTAAGTGPITIALGRTADVEAWLGQDEATWVTGLASLSELATHTGPAEATATPSEPPTEAEDSTTDTADPDAATASPEVTEEAVEGTTGEPAEDATDEAAEDAADEATALTDPAGSDLWYEEAVGEGSATFEWTATEGRWSLLVAAPESEAVTVTTVWPQTVTTPWFAPGVYGGAVLLVLGLVWWALLILRSRRPALGLGVSGFWGHLRDVLVPLPAVSTVPTEAKSQTDLDEVPVGGQRPGPAAFDEPTEWARPEPVTTSDPWSTPTRPQGPSVVPGAVPAAMDSPDTYFDDIAPHSPRTPSAAEAPVSPPGQSLPAGFALGADGVPVNADGTPLTRRQLRELRQRAEIAHVEQLEAERSARHTPDPAADKGPQVTPTHDVGSGLTGDPRAVEEWGSGAPRWPQPLGTGSTSHRSGIEPSPATDIPAGDHSSEFGALEPSPAEQPKRRRGARSWFGRRGLASRSVTPVPEPTPDDTPAVGSVGPQPGTTASVSSPDTPLQDPGATVRSGDAWRRAWGLPAPAPSDEAPPAAPQSPPAPTRYSGRPTLADRWPERSRSGTWPGRSPGAGSEPDPTRDDTEER